MRGRPSHAGALARVLVGALVVGCGGAPPRANDVDDEPSAETEEEPVSEEAPRARREDVEDTYPEVAIVAAVFEDDTWFPVGSGVLVTPDRVVTVAHNEGGFPALFTRITGREPPAEIRWGAVFTQRVAFDGSGPLPSTPFSELERGHLGALHSRPGYRMGRPGQRQADGADNDDIAVLVLERPVEGIEPAELAPVGYLDALPEEERRALTFRTVGFGLDYVANPSQRYDGVRRIGVAGFDALDDRGALGVNTRQADGYQSICFGDSGGPVYVGEGHLVVAVIDELEPSCMGDWNEHQRVDIPSIRDFLRGHGVEVPSEAP